jgi:hypothetical protein
MQPSKILIQPSKIPFRPNAPLRLTVRQIDLKEPPSMADCR